MPQSPHRGPLPGFLMCKYRSFPPGVLMTRVRFERVLSNCKQKMIAWGLYREDGDGR